jgi:hypothetical protein
MSLIPRYLSTALILTCFAAGPAFPQTPDDKQTNFLAYIQKAKGYLDEKRPDLAILQLQAAAVIEPGSDESALRLA